MKAKRSEKSEDAEEATFWCEQWKSSGRLVRELLDERKALVAKAALADEMVTELFRLHRDVCDECETFGKCHSAKLIYRYDRLHEKEKGKGTP